MGKENPSIEEEECGWGGDSWVTGVPSKVKVRRLEWVLYDVDCCLLSQSFQMAGVSGQCSSVWLYLLSVRTFKGISSFKVLPSENLINFGLSLFSFLQRSQISQKITFNCFLIINSFYISLCAETYFFILKKISALATSSECSPILLIGIAIILLYDKSEEISVSHITFVFAFRFSLTWSGSTWKGPINGLK